MAYPEQHNLLTIHWTMANVPSEAAQCGLRFRSVAFPSQADLDSVAAAIATFWEAGTAAIAPQYQLTFLRLARIDTDGSYVPNIPSIDHGYSPLVGGGGTNGYMYPLQVAHVATLLTQVTRGLAYKGRIYLPPLNVAPGTDALLNVVAVNNRMNTLATMLSALQGSALGEMRVYSKGNAAVPGGASQLIVGVQADTRMDVQRRRAEQQNGVLSVVGNVN